MASMRSIRVRVIPHKKQRYPTCGDYYYKNGELQIRISRMNAKHEFLVLIHELVEWFLIENAGISIKEIDDFDIAFEKSRKPTNEDEPGDDPNAPYREQHQFATTIEKLLAQKIGVAWDVYNRNVNKL